MVLSTGNCPSYISQGLAPASFQHGPSISSSEDQVVWLAEEMPGFAVAGVGIAAVVSPGGERAATCARPPRARGECTKFPRAGCRRRRNQSRTRCSYGRYGWLDGERPRDRGRLTCAGWFLPGRARVSCRCPRRSHSVACARRAATGRSRGLRLCIEKPVHPVRLPLVLRSHSAGGLAGRGSAWTLECVRGERAGL